MASFVVDDWEQLVSEPVLNSDNYVSPVDNAVVANVATFLADVDISVNEELVYSTVLNENDTHLADMSGNRGMFTPRNIRQYIADYYNPPQPRGGGRNHKYIQTEDHHVMHNIPVTKKNFADSELFDECREVLARQPAYVRQSREGQKKMLMRFVRLCESRRELAEITGGKEHTNFSCKYYINEFMAPYSQRGSLLQSNKY
jgi:hypothetical protein